VKGRAAVALATSSKVQTPARVRPWAPADACELASDAGWTLHTTARWVFASESLARHRLLTLVRGLLFRSEMLPEGRALAVARDQEQWRIWLLTPAVPSLAEELLLAIETCNPAAITSSVEHAVLAVRELRGLGFGESAVRAGSAGLGLVDGRPVLLTLDEGDDSGTPRSQEPLAELASLLLESANGEQTLNASVSDALATIARAQTERREHS
jgi:hypothetical protein